MLNKSKITVMEDNDNSRITMEGNRSEVDGMQHLNLTEVSTLPKPNEAHRINSLHESRENTNSITLLSIAM